MPKGGRMQIEMERREDRVRVAVRDTGPGIPGGAAGADLRERFHDQGRRQRHRSLRCPCRRGVTRRFYPRPTAPPEEGTDVQVDLPLLPQPTESPDASRADRRRRPQLPARPGRGRRPRGVQHGDRVQPGPGPRRARQADARRAAHRPAAARRQRPRPAAGDRGTRARPEVILITGHASVETAVRRAASAAPPTTSPSPSTSRASRWCWPTCTRTRELKEEIGSLRTELRKLGRFGAADRRGSPAMQQVYDLIARVAPTEATVLITGESGTGKELVAQTDPRAEPAPQGAVPADQLRRGLAQPDRERAVRPRARQLHGRGPRAPRLLRARQRRHAVPRRDHRDADRAAGEAPARAGDGRP